jgi:hypothetical protein
MPSKSKSVNAAALLAAGIPQRGFSIPQWCARWDISEGHYRALRKLKRTPRELELLDRKIITDEAENEWLAAEAEIAQSK